MDWERQVAAAAAVAVAVAVAAAVALALTAINTKYYNRWSQMKNVFKFY